MRLSLIAAQKFKLSRRYVKAAIKDGQFKVDGKIIKKDQIISLSSTVEYLSANEAPHISIDVDKFIILKTHDVCFIYKPPFVHSERLCPKDIFTVSDIWSQLPQYLPLSRLDYEADGVVGGINKDIPIDFIKKKYLAIVAGKFPEKIILSNKINADKTKKVSVLEDLKGYPTLMQRLSFNGDLSLISVELEKAARHQVRAFCAYAGHPILGDKLYGGLPFKRLCLHCESYFINKSHAQSGKFASEFTNLIDFKG